MLKKFYLFLLFLLIFTSLLCSGCTSDINIKEETKRETETVNLNETNEISEISEISEMNGGNMENPTSIEPPGVELLKNADFSDGLKNWRQYDKCKPEIIIEPQGGKNAVLVTEMSQNWAVVCQNLTKPLNEYGRGIYYFGAKVKTNGGSTRIMAVVHYRDDTGRNWITSDYVDINDKDFTYIDKTAIIDWSGEKVSEVDIYLSTDKPFGGGLIIDSMTFRHVSENTTVEGLNRPDVSLRNERALIGVIRWDAWIGDGEGGVGQVVNRSLSPEKYHFRLPWFSTILGPDEVFIDGATQETVDKEIQFAKTYGIDYFAVLHYNDGMSFARKAYLNSLYRNGIKWCALLESHRFTGDLAVFDYYIEEFKKPYYQKTTDGRPVVYIFQVESQIKDGLDDFRQKCEKAGVPEPYVIGMNFDIPKAAMLSGELGLQGISLYTGGIPSAGCSYSKVMDNDASKWRGMKKTGAQFVPQITTGWDKRPRYDNPNPWEPDYEDFKNQYAEQGTPEEIARNISNAFDFNEENKEQTVFNSVLVYAWNENDEGGWICPTYFELRDSGKPLRLDAIREMLKSRRAAYIDIDTLDTAEKEAVENLAVAGVFEDIAGDRFEPQKEISAKEFAAYFMRSVGYLIDFEIENGGDVPITNEKAMQIAIEIIKTAGDTKPKQIDTNTIRKGDGNLTRAGAAFIIDQLTKEIFDLPTEVK